MNLFLIGYFGMLRRESLFKMNNLYREEYGKDKEVRLVGGSVENITEMDECFFNTNWELVDCDEMLSIPFSYDDFDGVPLESKEIYAEFYQGMNI